MILYRSMGFMGDKKKGNQIFADCPLFERETRFPARGTTPTHLRQSEQKRATRFSLIALYLSGKRDFPHAGRPPTHLRQSE